MRHIEVVTSIDEPDQCVFELFQDELKERNLFLDLDGTLIENIGHNAEFTKAKFFPAALKKLQEANAMKFGLHIVTNQSGIGREYFSIEDLLKYHLAIYSFLHDMDIVITSMVTCPHSPLLIDCKCRKPSPSMVNFLCSRFSINKAKAIFLGDMETDRASAITAGVEFLLVRSNVDWERLDLEKF